MAKPAESAQSGGGCCDIRHLVVNFHQDVYRYAFRLSGSAADADDLSQQAFLVAQQKLTQLRETSKAKSWLLAITRSLFLKSLRKRKPTSAVDLELDLQSFCGDIPDSKDFDSELLHKAIAELPNEFRVVLMMFYFEEMSYKEIASQLEVPAGTVMSRLSRAKSHLRKRLTSKQDASSITTRA